MTHPHVAPSLGRPITCPADARELWRKHFGAHPVPATNPRVPRTTEQAWREHARRAQLEAARARLASANELPWPDAESAWLDAFRLARAVFVDETP
ncbi:hypothetical protein [Nocardia sp. CY41]|uniref:hypothetical protein n=1 Tax=Nocardia sp. CY41 TaxID=2608686 RepID=UPI001357F902|nr:hypothetical protein [Nocardia sp. CY41]